MAQEYLNIQLRDTENRRVWEEAERAVAASLDEDPDQLNRNTVARELAEAYVGGQPLGSWQQDEAAEGD